MDSGIHILQCAHVKCERVFICVIREREGERKYVCIKLKIMFILPFCNIFIQTTISPAIHPSNHPSIHPNMEKSGLELKLVVGLVISLVAIAGTVLVLATLILCYKRYNYSIDPHFHYYIDTLQSL